MKAISKRTLLFCAIPITLLLFLSDATSEQNPPTGPLPYPALERISVATSGAEGDYSSYTRTLSSLSSDGRYVTFESDATNLVANDENDSEDVFVRDRLTEQTILVSVDSSGNQAGFDSDTSTISADGHRIAFESTTSDLVANDNNDAADIFVRDLATETTTRVSVDSEGHEGDGYSYGPASLSEDGRYVAFISDSTNLVENDTNGTGDVFVRDRQTGTTTRVSVSSSGAEGNESSWAPAISADGRYVSFASAATNLVPNDTNGRFDTFVHDRVTGETIRVSVDSDGFQGIPSQSESSESTAISSDGRFVTFDSGLNGLIPSDMNGESDLFVHDMQTGGTLGVSFDQDGVSTGGSQPTISADGRYIAFQGGCGVTVHETESGQNWCANVTATGQPVENDPYTLAGISANGRYLALSSGNVDLVVNDTNDAEDVFVADWAVIAGVPDMHSPVERVNVSISGDQDQFGAHVDTAISADGRYVAFDSWADLVNVGWPYSRSDIFFRDTQTNEITRIVSSDESYSAGSPTLSADGRYVAFWSDASDLVQGDGNGDADLFIRDRASGQTTRVNVDSDGYESSGGSGDGQAISSDGRYVAFASRASDLVADDTNGTSDVFVHDVLTGDTERISVDSDGNEAVGDSVLPAISADGRYISFTSSAGDLTPDDTNEADDVFIHDRQSDQTRLVSISNTGGQASGGADYSRSSISADGRYVAFDSSAGDLVADDENETRDVFVRDLLTEITTRVSENTNGAEGDGESIHPSLSADGRYVAFASWSSNLVDDDTNDALDVFLRDTQSNLTWRASVTETGAQANSESYAPTISADGRHVAYVSDANNLVSGDTNEADDVFVTDLGRLLDLGPASPNTPIGSSIVVEPEDPTSSSAPVTITFSEVTGAGETSLSTSTSGPMPPAGYSFGDPPLYFELTTTAAYAGPINVCITYDAAAFTDPSGLRLLHFEDGTWADITTSNDVDAGEICGSVASLSPFAIGYQTDVIPPVITASVSPATNENGWWKTSPTVSFTCSDADSGIASCPEPVTVVTEGADQVVTGVATDNAGNSAQVSVEVSLDLTDPVVSCPAPPSFELNQPEATLTATVSDELSGPLTSSVTVDVPTLSVGESNVDIIGYDRAGRSQTASCSYRVGYAVEAFSAPINNPPTVNKAKAGQTIPVKWRLTDALGLPVFDPASFVSITSGAGTCSPSDPTDEIETYSGSSGLQYQGNGWWQFNWKSLSGYAGQCRVMRLNLADGQPGHLAYFQFR
jgi:Tol biopolymer transport system component